MIWLVLAGCATASECDSGQPLGWDGWADGFFATYCRTCHSPDSPDRRGAPVGVDFENPQDVLLHQDAVWRRVIDEQTMPVGGGLLDEDLLLLEQYLSCDPVAL